MSLAIIDSSKVPSLENAQPATVAIGSEYWTPENAGEKKKCFILGVEVQEYQKVDDKTGEVIETVDLPCVVMAVPDGLGGYTQFGNGSKRLVGVVEEAEKKGAVIYGETPLQITFTGKKRNKTNANMSDTWDVRPLITG